MKRLAMLAAFATLIGMLGCSSMTPKEKGMVTGALTGLGIAAITGESVWAGATVGAIAGGIAGNIKGSQQK